MSPIAAVIALLAAPLLAGSLALPQTDAAGFPGAPGRARHPDWDLRDAEGRWALIAPDLARDHEAAKEWVAFLAAEREHELLEWIVLTSPNGWTKAREALVAADAPQWIRASAWRAGAGDSHVRGAVLEDLTAARGTFLGWLALHPEAREGPVAAIADDLAGTAEPDVAAAERYAPPIPEDALWAPLFHEGPVADLGQRTRAEPGVVYAQTIERAIAVLAAQRERPSAARERLAQLVTHPHEGVARAAALALTHFPERDVPIDALLAAARDEELGAARREAAFLAASYGWPARAAVELHVAALRPNDPVWRAAVSRLGDLGDGYTLSALADLPRSTLRPTDAELFDRSLARIRAREAERGRPDAKRARELLERMAYADLVCATIETPLGTWTMRDLRPGADDAALRAALAELAAAYEPDPAFDDLARFGGMGERVRRYARELLDG